MKTETFRLEGVSPLILHNARLSDPLDEYTQALAEVTAKKKKSLADHVEIGRREWFGGMYQVDGAGDPCVPAANIERMIRDAAARSKRGKDVQAAMIVEADAPIEYDGPKDLDALWASGKFSKRASAKVGQMRVIRTRPCFRKWALEFTAHYDETIINPKHLVEWVKLGGILIGLTDWRPRNGRFLVTSHP